MSTPARVRRPSDAADANQRGAGDEPTLVVSQKGRSLIVLAVEIDTLVAEAARVNGVIEFVPQVGDFVAADEPLFRLYGSAAAIDETTLRECVAFGSERTMEQDPMFSFRILVGHRVQGTVARDQRPDDGGPGDRPDPPAAAARRKATTARRGRARRRGPGPAAAPDAELGRLRPHVAFTEIRACGANNVQIARRMRAMLENLVHSLPESRHAALKQQLDLLDRTLPDYFQLPRGPGARPRSAIHRGSAARRAADPRLSARAAGLTCIVNCG